MPAASYLGGMIGSAVLNAVLQVLLVIVIGHVLYDVDWPADWLLLAGFTMLGVVCFGSLGVAFAHAIPNVDSAPAWVNAVFLPLIFISGVFYSSDSLPGVLKAVAEALPLKHLIDGLSAAIVGGGERHAPGSRRWWAAGPWSACCWPCATSAGASRRLDAVAAHPASRVLAHYSRSACPWRRSQRSRSRQSGQRSASSAQKRSEWSCTARCATSCSTT